MTDPALCARLTELQKRLTQATPVPLEGQQALDLSQPPGEPDEPPRRPSRPAPRQRP